MDPKKPNTVRPEVEVPATEGWPVVAAFGVSLVWAGMLTHWLVTALGAVCLIAGLINWFREVLPREAHEKVAIEPEPEKAVTPSVGVRHLQVGELGHRARLPLAIHPWSAGVRGGLVGGAAMVVLALLYGIIFHGSIWYPINLLAAAGSANLSAMSTEQLRAFNGTGLLLATVIHLIGSTLVGVLYGVALPMFPRHPVLFGGILAPVFWSGLLYSSMGIINPALQERVDWFWFMGAQVAFGVVTGWVVARREQIATLQFVPFAMRAGVEAAGLDGDSKRKDS
ncbi:MAG TPA: hypothetical protein PLX89_20665 [Verrucomicrobiota bacterium]|nr:hypothetical protein [Verrucomicrobiota bacterium]